MIGFPKGTPPEPRQADSWNPAETPGIEKRRAEGADEVRQDHDRLSTIVLRLAIPVPIDGYG
jgi:hypothetical protein